MNIPSALQQANSDHRTLARSLRSYSQQQHQRVLEIVDIQKAYLNKQVLEHINLDLRAGELISSNDKKD